MGEPELIEAKPKEPSERLVARIAGLAVLGIYALAAALPATYFHGNEDVYHGYQYLSCGWMGPCNPTPLYGWYGNPLFLFGFLALLLRRGWVAAGLAIAGLLVALQSLQLTAGLAPNEGGVVTLHFVRWAPGFFLWLTSYLALAAAGIGFELWRRRRSAPASK